MGDDSAGDQPVNRMHLLRSSEGEAVLTFCGRLGWPTTVRDEYDNVAGGRFEARHSFASTTCRACLKAVPDRPQPTPPMEERMTSLLDDEAIKVLVVKSIVDSLTPEKREVLISNAIASLLDSQEGKDGYGRPTKRPSKLQEAFDNAVGFEANRIAREMLATDPAIKEALAKLMADAWQRMISADRYEPLVEKVAAAMTQGLTGRERY